MENNIYNPEGLSLQIFQDRYAIHAKETFHQACKRVARLISNAEVGDDRDKYYTEFLNILRTNRFSPGGRIWRGAGRPKGQLLNCFVWTDDLDSKEGWGDVLRAVTIISSTGGGVGINFSQVRPRGTIIRGTGGKATGAVSLMRAINGVCNELSAGGEKRSALMFCLKYDHPDLLEFLESKLEKGELNNANISICIDDHFLKLLDRNDDIVLQWKGKEKSRVAARDIWNKIVNNAWESGDPGILNIGFANDMNTISYQHNLVSTNPCFTKEMRLHTNQGIVSLQELFESGTPNQVITDNRCLNTILENVSIRKASPVKKTGTQQQIYKITTSHGHTIRCTEYHEFITPFGERKPLCSLSRGCWINLQPGEGSWGNIGDYGDGLIMGSFVGDGTISRVDGNDTMCLDYWNETELCNRVLNLVNTKINNKQLTNTARNYGPVIAINCTQSNKQRISSIRLTRYFNQILDTDIKILKIRVPEVVWKGSRELVVGYLSGLFQADGSIQIKDRGTKSSLSIRLAQSNKLLLKDVQILLNNFGIVSSIYKRRSEQYRNLPNGHNDKQPYLCKSQYELIINRPNAVVFEKSIGFAGNKQKQLVESLNKIGRQCRKPERFITKIESIEQDGIEDVYCLNEPTTHSLIVNGLTTGNCGEIWMPPYDCCCLGAINLHSHVVNGQIDCKMLEETIYLSVRFLDNVIDQNNYPMSIIEETCQKYRRIGLGVMGLHDMLLELGLKYSTEEAREMVDKVMNFIKEKAYHISILLSREKGPFHGLNPEEHIETGFIKKCLPEKYSDLIKKYGIRNCAILTIAPTGTISIVAGCSSGIEPLFQPIYQRRFNQYQSMGDRIDDHNSVEIVIHPLLREFILHNRSIDHFQGAHDILPEEHLAMQAICQKHIDNSISKTINLSKGYPVERLSDDMREYINKLKGITIYRDGSKGESPLIPLTLIEAEQCFEQMKIEASVNDCPSGVCEVEGG